MEKRRIGEMGEDAASRYLTSKGYSVIERNFRLRCGELDIVAADGDGCMVFAEVKTRKNDEFGFPSEYVTERKRKKLRNTALLYCDGERCNMRFDIIEVYYEFADNKMRITKINHIEDAF